jgi:NAD+ synthase
MKFDLSCDVKEVITITKDFIKTYVENSGLDSVVLGLSGGIDSAVVALLCQQVLGKKNTYCLFLPEEATPKSDYRDLEIFVKKFNINCEIKEITDLVKNFQNNCLISPEKIALGNVKARIRMILLFEYANMKKSLVCGTSNKSELLVGYFTKYGDGGVDFMPLGDVYKTQVWELAKYLDISKKMIEKPPAAGLCKGEVDEDELKLDYYTLDKILYGLERKMTDEEIAQVVDISFKEVKRIRNMRIKSQHKRRLPLIPKVGLRTPGLDWRTPILKG